MRYNVKVTILATSFIFHIMSARTVESLRIAILGSGISGSTAARTLVEQVKQKRSTINIEVTVFEAGYGIGGRTSTRITRDEFKYQFDHGAQYIGTPKTNTFRNTLDQWIEDKWVQKWTGNFFNLHLGKTSENQDTANDCPTSESLTINMEKEHDAKERYVGYPGMHSICRHLLHHENIIVKLHTRANAIQNFNGKWELNDDKTNEMLGTYDWLIASDRLSGGYNRRDLKGADVKEFTSTTKQIESIKSLTAMVVFEKPLGINIDTVQLVGNNYDKFGSLGWISRDSSKPGRLRSDGKECWILQSHPEAANELLKGKRNIQQIRDMAKDILVQDFLASIPYLVKDTDTKLSIPNISYAVGHRWGAAFPIASQNFKKVESQIIPSKHFVACGDYFGEFSGRIEGSYLSGLSAANQLLDEILAN